MATEPGQTVSPDLHRMNSAEGPKRAGSGLILAYVFAYLGVWMGALTPLIVSLPIRVRQVDPQNYVSDLSVILAVGAFCAMLANPFFGGLSDRTTSRLGMRRPWLLIGAAAGILSVLTIAAIPSIVAIAIGWCLAQIAANILLAVTTAILPDQIPIEQRGRVSGYLSMCVSVAPVFGVYIVEHFVGSPLWMFLVPALIMSGSCLLLALVLRDRRMAPHEVAPYSLGVFLSSFWVNWLKYPDFSCIWVSRFLRFISLSLVLSYQVYFVADRLGIATSQVPHIILIGTLVNALMGVVGANAAGFLSDRTKRRKIFLVYGGLIYAVGMLVLAFGQSVSAFYIAIGIAGLGQGAFVALDFAVVVEVLPDSGKSSAKNLGVFNIANALPQSVAPALAPMILNTGGGRNYAALFMVGALTAAVGAVLVPLIKKVR